jgi:hypothetical protein
MRLYVNLDNLQFISAPGVNRVPEAITFKRGDAAVVQVRFLDGGVTPVRLPEGVALVFVVKAQGDYDGTPLAISDVWTAPPIGEFDYTCYPNFNTVELNTALRSDGFVGNDLPYITTMFEITWSVGAGLPTSTKTFPLTVYNDLYKGSEASPTPASLSYPPANTILTEADVPRFAPAGSAPLPTPIPDTVFGVDSSGGWIQRTAAQLKSFLNLVIGDIAGLATQLSNLSTQIAGKANASDVATALALKPDASAISGKADLIYVDTQLALKADKTELIPFATKTEVATDLGALSSIKADKTELTGKQDTLGNAATLQKIGEAAGVPTWNGGDWPGAGGLTDSGVGVSLIDSPPFTLRRVIAGTGISIAVVGSALQINASGTANGAASIVSGYASDSFQGIGTQSGLVDISTGWGWFGKGNAMYMMIGQSWDTFTGVPNTSLTTISTGSGWLGDGAPVSMYLGHSYDNFTGTPSGTITQVTTGSGWASAGWYFTVSST